MEELRKCPFCGGEVGIGRIQAGKEVCYRVSCKECSGSGAWFHTVAEAIAAWNRRVEG
jgi:Lar family restriction alleviation protein